MFKFTVELFDKIEGTIKESGLIGAKNYEEAVKYLVNFYGKIESIKITIYETPILLFEDLQDIIDAKD